MRQVSSAIMTFWIIIPPTTANGALNSAVIRSSVRLSVYLFICLFHAPNLTIAFYDYGYPCKTLTIPRWKSNLPVSGTIGSDWNGNKTKLSPVLLQNHSLGGCAVNMPNRTVMSVDIPFHWLMPCYFANIFWAVITIIRQPFEIFLHIIMSLLITICTVSCSF